MSLKIIIGILLVIALTLYIAYFNPTKITIMVFKDISYDFPTAFFVFGLFFLGALVSTLVHTLKSYKRSLLRWRESVQLKRERQTEDNYIQGLRALWEGRNKEAKSAFQAVLQKQSDHVDSMIKLGDVFRSEGSYDEAIKMHLKARSLSGDSILVLRCLESDYRQDSRKRELIETLE
ncbi:MAG: hypothetical protein HY730_08635, partial [Candidatus Tectomicrobia bacterium]|nr:hypothetical protein [Candidatus Tectomicrobia bacterium]